MPNTTDAAAVKEIGAFDPVTVTITDEVAYEAYIAAKANGQLFRIGALCRDAANHVPSGPDLEAFAIYVDDFVGLLKETGIARCLPEDNEHRKWIEGAGDA
jgi:hypothetical protein